MFVLNLSGRYTKFFYIFQVIQFQAEKNDIKEDKPESVNNDEKDSTENKTVEKGIFNV